MVFYHTSINIKTMRNIILDYETVTETSPCEYMKNYVEKCPNDIDDCKLAWIAETFLGLRKHYKFLKEIAHHLSEEISEEDQAYFIIIFHAITFQIQPKDMPLVYKCLFNVSKTLLYTFTNFLSNNEVLTFISQVAHAYYDANFITDKIIGPLFLWQPYISEMGHNYAEYVQKLESRKVKPPTVPVQPTVLTRKPKEATHNPSLPTILVAPPNSVYNKSRKMLTKSAIDRRLDKVREKNKQKTETLLNSRDNYYIPKSEKKIFNAEPEPFQQVIKAKKFIDKVTGPPIKETVASIKRMNKKIQLTEQKEMDWFYDLLTCTRNPAAKYEELAEYERKEKERERLYEIEKKHLMGQISYEEAVLAKKKVLEQNKKKYEEVIKEKESWSEQMERWKKRELEETRKRVEKCALLELNVKEARNDCFEKKKENAAQIKLEKELWAAKAMKEKKEELDRRIKMIKEIKVLSLIATNARIPRVIDLTETSGVGLLCEMSIAELQERLTIMKIGIKEEIEKKRAAIKTENEVAKKGLESVKTVIKSFIDERAYMRQRNNKLVKEKKPVTLEGAASKEINDLKKVLEEKRKMRASSNL